MTLIAAFVLTGFASSAYHRRRTALGVLHYDEGRAREIHGDLEPAIEEYRKALIFEPDKAEYRLSLATALLEDGRLNEAQTHLEQLSQEDPTSGPINLLMGRLAVQQHKLKQAIDYYQRGVYEYWPEAELPQRRQARWELANLLNETGDRSGFVGELMQLYTNLPAGSTTDKLRVGSLLLANGASSEASRIFQDLTRQAPLNAAVRRGMGEVYFSSGEFISARHEFQRALKLDPKDKESAQALALTNDVVDMDPALPYISSAEQIRRSRNLLSRIIKDLEACGSRSDTTKARLDEAGNLLTQVKKNEDEAFTLQTTAAQLWASKDAACGKASPEDRALDTVFARINRE